MEEKAHYVALKKEVLRLFEYLQKIKGEIASVKHPKSEVDHFDTVADQLEAIVKATEEATETIMESAETISETAAGMGGAGEGGDGNLDKINDSIGAIFEACSFQDITGQRISKIVKTMNLIEGTLNSLVVILGESGLAALPLADNMLEKETEEDGTPAMHGPQLEGEGVSQEDIDKLFD